MNDKLRHGGRRAAEWIEQFAGRTGWALLILAVGLIIGWWAGSYTACSQAKCHVRVDAIEAAGTWVGGLGTMAAVLFAINAFQAEQRNRLEEQLRRDREEHLAVVAALADAQEEEHRARADAELVIIDARIRVSDASHVMGVAVVVRNHSNATSIYKLSGEIVGYGPIPPEHEVPAGRWSYPADYGSAGTATDQLPTPLAGEGDDARRAFEQNLRARVTITFEMNDRRWRRAGNDPVELIS
ncbi:hypothetical protein ACFPJ1_29465 [Kribbella qitaiheensis]|uniref:hypothetical protein n=1 Tax=Kribbella qitaiheensis TaxID=1544730 RepID=UPI003619A407